METVHMNEFIAASPARVWAVLTDYEGYARIPKVKRARVLERGTEHPAGVGAVREISVLGSTFVEQITRFEPERHLSYQIIRSRPLPLQHHGADVVLTARDGGTEIDWTTRLSLRIPLVGGLLAKPLRAIVQRQFTKMLRWIKADLEREQATQPRRAAS
jgi:uncharacterized protein YndB with AHSA1/START domain